MTRNERLNRIKAELSRRDDTSAWADARDVLREYRTRRAEAWNRLYYDEGRKEFRDRAIGSSVYLLPSREDRRLAKLNARGIRGVWQ